MRLLEVPRIAWVEGITLHNSIVRNVFYNILLLNLFICLFISYLKVDLCQKQFPFHSWANLEKPYHRKVHTNVCHFPNNSI